MWSSVPAEHSIAVHWKLSCSDEPIVVGYNITYCMMNDDALDKCAESPISEVVILTADDEMLQYEIANLKSFKLYNISVALMSHTRLGIPKAPITVRTLEGGKFNKRTAFTVTMLINDFSTAPSAPRNLRAVDINRHSINLAWNRPKEVNGELMTYELWYNDHKININDNSTMNETYKFNLEHLEAFTDYTITVRACTSNCSESSDSLTLRTAVGRPGTMFQPVKTKLDKDNQIRISWQPPSVRGGNLDYFELKIIPSESHLRPAVYRINGKETSCIIERFNCEQDTINFVIRSVNIEHATPIENENAVNQSVNCFAIPEPIHGEVNGHFYGEWSQPIIFYCSAGYSLALTGLVILTTILLVIAAYLFIRFYQKYQRMKDIHVVWPDGLDPWLFKLPQNKLPFDGVKDLDLVKDHVLTDIEEEEEVTEREKFIPEPKLESVNSRQQEQPVIENPHESSKSEIFLPFIYNPKTNEIFYELPKKTSYGQKQSKSAPVTPEKASSSYNENNPHIDVTGYTTMYAPEKSRLESCTSEGYLDMSGKSPPPVRNGPTSIDYTRNEIETFINDSEINNNGYIGKRTSILIEPNMKLPPIVNSNGYVGLCK